MTIITVLPNGKILAQQSASVTVNAPAGGAPPIAAVTAINVQFRELRGIDTVLGIKFDVSPGTAYPGESIGDKITDNIVGLTLVGISPTLTGATVTPYVLATGFS